MNYFAAGMYSEAIKHLLSVSKKYGGKTGHMQRVEFFFYADTEDKGSNLAIELAGMGYSIYGIDKSGDSWSVIGATTLMAVNEETLTKWGEAMYALADRTEVIFDGWGMVIER
jgi:hypothetical protein